MLDKNEQQQAHETAAEKIYEVPFNDTKQIVKKAVTVLSEFRFLEMDFFVHNTIEELEAVKTNSYTVTEKQTGSAMATAPTIKQAIRNTKEVVHQNKERLPELMAVRIATNKANKMVLCQNLQSKFATTPPPKPGMTTIAEMGAMRMHSDEWFKAAFESCTALPYAKQAATKICRAYGITGQADPAYIANVITEANQ